MTLPSEEHIFQYPGQGRIEVICGSMFSGKTEELIRRLKRAKFAKQRVEIFKPAIDTRYSQDNVVTIVIRFLLLRWILPPVSYCSLPRSMWWG